MADIDLAASVEKDMGLGIRCAFIRAERCVSNLQAPNIAASALPIESAIVASEPARNHRVIIRSPFRCQGHIAPPVRPSFALANAHIASTALSWVMVELRLAG